MTVFTGTTGDDSLHGSKHADDFHIEQGGDDSAAGGLGDDSFFLGASFTGADQLDGGANTDLVLLDGDYSAGVALTATTITAIETMHFAAGNSYSFTGLSDANLTGVEPGHTFLVDGRDLGADDSLRFDASHATIGVHLEGGAGDDRLTGGSGVDIFSGNGGHDTLIGGAGDDDFNLSSEVTTAKGGDGDDLFEIRFPDQLGRSKLDGGAGFDTIAFTSFSGEDTEVFGGRNFRNVEKLTFNNGPYDVTLADGNVAAGQVLIIDASKTSFFTFDGSAELDGAFNVTGAHAFETPGSILTGGAGNDTLNGTGDQDFLTGGGGDDIMHGGGGNMVGGGGDDTIGASRSIITGGAGADLLKGARDTFVYHSVDDSTASETDVIKGLGKAGKIDLAPIDADTTTDGDQAFHQVLAFTHTAGELVITYDAEHNLSQILGDVDGDGTADLVIDAPGGDFTGFTNFVL